QDIATNQEYWALHDRLPASLDKLMAYQSYDQTLVDGGSASRVRTTAVTDGFWSITGLRASAGRLPTEGERNVVVLSERLYATSFGSDPTTFGRVITLDRVPVTVVGVVSNTFRFQFPVMESSTEQPRDIDLFRTYTVSPPSPSFAQLLSIVGRLSP